MFLPLYFNDPALLYSILNQYSRTTPRILVLSVVVSYIGRIGYLEIFGIHEASALCVEQTKKETIYYTFEKEYKTTLIRYPYMWYRTQ
jgi:hypothetical protein